jgi:sulfite exporter TauE/SafE
VSISLLSVTGIGFIVGFRHAFEPDHLAAVTTLATRQGGWNLSARLGVAWGIGHTLSVAVVAAVLIVLGIRVPERFYATAELGVAALLVILGLTSLWQEARRHRGSLGAAHAAAHEAQASHVHPGQLRSTSRALGFGVAHGLAGSGAVIVLLVAAATSLREQATYLLAFGAGTVAGMTGVSLLTGVVTGAVARTHARAALSLRVGAAVASTAVGLMLGWSTLSG